MRKSGLCFIVILYFSLYCGDIFSVDFHSLKKLYIQNNRELHELEIKVRQSKIDAEKIYIQNGIDFTLSTGNINFNTNSENTEISFSPNAKISLPQINDSSLNVDLPITIKKNNEESITELDNIGISFQSGIISSNKKTREINLLKADRNILVALRNYEKGKVNVEKSFLQDLQKLYTLLNDVASSEDNLIEKELEFEEILVQGYSENSSDYLFAKMDVLRCKRDVHEKQKEFEYELTLFKNNCGKDFNFTENDLLNLILPETSLRKISEYKKENYVELENAFWVNKINNMSREADIPFSLYGNLGYGLSQQISGSENTNTTHNLNLGVEGNYKGFTSGIKTSIPIKHKEKPSVSMSLGWNLGDMKTGDLEKSEDELSLQLELLAIEEAEENYAKDSVDFFTKARDLLWKKNENNIEKKLYAELEEDMKMYFENGIINETKYRQAKTNFKTAQLNCVLSEIECMIFNIELNLLFIPSELEK